MTHWTVEIMVYRSWGSPQAVEVGRRISADGGKSWIEEGEIDASFKDTFTDVTRRIGRREYHSRFTNRRAVSVIFPLTKQ